MNRRDFIKNIGLATTSIALAGCGFIKKSLPAEAVKDRPNIILLMADDLGWGDVAYNGNLTAHTPNLDNMASQGLRFDRFYAAAPVCSPTRGSCLTGRHPYRYNIPWAGEYPLPSREVTIAEALKDAGYATGHFGKWHLGGLSKTVKQSYFPGQVDPAKYSPPWENGFDECFSTESMMPTYNPYYHQGPEYGKEGYRNVMDRPVEKGSRTGGFRWRDFYWTGPGQIVDQWLKGDDSQIIMDRALNFISRNSSNPKPFFTAVWFHTPHTPVVAGNDDRQSFPKQTIEAQHWFGCIKAMDRQIGRLRSQLRTLGIADNTILWFCSDNGPSYIHDWNSAGGLRGKKATLWEGGIRVPAILEWPAMFKKPQIINAPVCTSDFYPTLVNLVNAMPKKQPVLDGIDIMPLLKSNSGHRTVPIAFQSPNKGSQWQMDEGKESFVLIDNRFKLISIDSGQTWQLYDLIEDIAETTDLSSQKPDVVKKMKAILKKWQKSCCNSAAGHDYS